MQASAAAYRYERFPANTRNRQQSHWAAAISYTNAPRPLSRTKRNGNKLS